MDILDFVNGVCDFTEGEDAVVIKSADFQRLVEWALQFPEEGRPNFDTLPISLKRWAD